MELIEMRIMNSFIATNFFKTYYLDNAQMLACLNEITNAQSHLQSYSF